MQYAELRPHVHKNETSLAPVTEPQRPARAITKFTRLEKADENSAVASYPLLRIKDK